MSNVQSQISNVRYQMSNFIHQMSNSKVKFECQMSNYKCQILIKAGKNYFSKITHFCRELKFLAKFT